MHTAHTKQQTKQRSKSFQYTGSLRQAEWRTQFEFDGDQKRRVGSTKSTRREVLEGLGEEQSGKICEAGVDILG